MSPIDILADELGSFAARVEKDAKQTVALEIETMRRMFAELRAENLELRQQVKDILANVKDGEQGPPGPQGDKGEQGQQGETGQAGEPGSRGEKGNPGQDGRDGAPGEKGDAGIQGPQGERGFGFTLRDVFNPEEIYNEGDVVILNASSFVARRENPGTPGEGDGWKLLAGRGKTGKPGERGERGPPGPKGDEAQQIVAATVDNGRLKLIRSDGEDISVTLTEDP